MASIRQEIVMAASPELVWDVLRDVVHELIVAIDDDQRRLAYAVAPKR